MKNFDYWVQIGTSQALSGDFERGAKSFREAMKLKPLHARTLFNLKLCLVNLQQGEFMVPHRCESTDYYMDDVFPSEGLWTMGIVGILEKQYNEVADSAHIKICKHCRRSVSIALALCQKCFSGWIGVYISEVPDQDHSKTINIMGTLPCMGCGYTPLPKKYKSKDERQLFNEIMRLRDKHRRRTVPAEKAPDTYETRPRKALPKTPSYSSFTKPVRLLKEYGSQWRTLDSTMQQWTKQLIRELVFWCIDKEKELSKNAILNLTGLDSRSVMQIIDEACEEISYVVKVQQHTKKFFDVILRFEQDEKNGDSETIQVEPEIVVDEQPVVTSVPVDKLSRKAAQELISSGISFEWAGENEKAIEAYRKVLESYPSSEEAKRYIFRVQKAIDRRKRGELLPWEQDAQRRAELVGKTKDTPDDADVWLSLAHFDLSNRTAGKAIPSLQQALELKPNDPEIHKLIGIAYIRKRKNSSAIRHFEKALEFYINDKDKAVVWHYLALMFSGTMSETSPIQAIGAIQNAIELDPENQEYVTTLEALHEGQILGIFEDEE
ncbi:MAG: tetratricopeptide repeat protein [Candidatus Thorarchaeota archaeon]